MRTVATILEYHKLSIADCVKAAQLNVEHAYKTNPGMPYTFEAGARSIAACLTTDTAEINALISAMQQHK